VDSDLRNVATDDGTKSDTAIIAVSSPNGKEWITMKRKFLLLIVTMSFLPIVSFAQTPNPGPYYFVSDDIPGPEQFYWGGSSKYGGIRVVENYNLLATVLGDNPAKLVRRGQVLVAQESFDFGAGPINLQPFAFTEGGGRKRNLPIGPNLNAFLSDPLGGAMFDLTLPFSDSRVALSDRSALLRFGETSTPGSWHTAVDLDVSGHTSEGFDVVAPADGIVEGNGNSDTLCLKHKAANGKEFLTIYAHMVPESKSHLTTGSSVVRGQVLGRVQSDGYTHLHFGVAVKGPSRTIGGTVVPELWYLIDPFGVYDYRRNRESQTNYNYLPNNTIATEVRGIHKAYVWRTNPLIGSLLLQEDCVGFNPDRLSIEAFNGGYRLNSGAHNLIVFPNMLEAGNSLSAIRKYGFTRLCFVGRPQSSFQYLR